MIKRLLPEILLAVFCNILYWFIYFCKKKWWPDGIIPISISIMSIIGIVLSIRNDLLKKKAENRELVRFIIDS
jgi:hypothetical protein